jgi:hypothetical protein
MTHPRSKKMEGSAEAAMQTIEPLARPQALAGRNLRSVASRVAEAFAGPRYSESLVDKVLALLGELALPSTTVPLDMRKLANQTAHRYFNALGTYQGTDAKEQCRLAIVDALDKVFAGSATQTFAPTHRHADGGLYRLAQEGRCYRSGAVWTDAIIYEAEDGKLYATTPERWADRFTALSPADGGAKS